jgi:hypothetical protein
LRVGFGLQAPAAVPIEVRTSQRRVFRLSHLIGEEGVHLVVPAPFEVGEPVLVRLRLPDSAAGEPIGDVLELRAIVELLDEPAEREGADGGCGLRFLEPPRDARQTIATYVAQRLGLPPA